MNIYISGLILDRHEYSSLRNNAMKDLTLTKLKVCLSTESTNQM